jgi:hypothetical protein
LLWDGRMAAVAIRRANRYLEQAGIMETDALIAP